MFDQAGISRAVRRIAMMLCVLLGGGLGATVAHAEYGDIVINNYCIIYAIE